MNQRAKNDDAVKIAIWICVGVALYALSSGPVMWGLDRILTSGHRHVAFKTFETVYAPLNWTYDHFPSTRPVLNAWCRLWVSDQE